MDTDSDTGYAWEKQDRMGAHEAYAHYYNGGAFG